MFMFSSKKTKFFDYFDRDADLLVRAAECFAHSLENYENPKQHSARLKELEHEADEVTHETLELLHRTFIAPLELGDLRRLILALDEVIDLIDDAGRRFAIYEIESVLPEVRAMGKVVVDIARAVQTAVLEIRTLPKKSGILEHCIEIQRLENVGDHLHHVALTAVFKAGLDPLRVVQWKEIIDLVEEALDRAEDVADVIEGVVLENA